jgi:hypothetical protein
LKARGIDESMYRSRPQEAGTALIELVQSWHDAEGLEKGGSIDLHKSFYLTLSWEERGFYQLHQFPLHLPDPQTIHWHFPNKTAKDGTEQPAVRLAGEDKYGTLFEWYGDTGGQLKYYPLVQDALWASERFRLEPLPESDDLNYGIISKAKAYFPTQWQTLAESETIY